jgi:hypothetical protein
MVEAGREFLPMAQALLTEPMVQTCFFASNLVYRVTFLFVVWLDPRTF